MAKEFNTIDDFDVEDKTVLVRIDINSPVDPGSGIILDDTRLKLHAQTVKELSNKGAKVVLLAHQSRPGKKDFTTLSQHAEALSDILNLRVKYVDSLFSNSAKERFKLWFSPIQSDYSPRTCEFYLIFSPNPLNLSLQCVKINNVYVCILKGGGTENENEL